jgi:acyl-CoA thioesterase-1
MTSRIRALGTWALGGLVIAVALASVSCSRPDERSELASPPSGARLDASTPTDRTTGPAADSTPTTGSLPRVVVLGDSLTAGLGLPIEEAYPTLLQQRLNDAGLGYEVINAGVSGDTSAGGLSRLNWALQGDVRVLIVALGGNDALRGLPAEQLKANLSTIIEEAQARGIAVILAGMEAPPNYGWEYQVAFHKVYPALAREYDVAFVPFLLQGVAGSATLNQSDGIHPTSQGARIVASNVWTALEPLAKRASLAAQPKPLSKK